MPSDPAEGRWFLNWTAVRSAREPGRAPTSDGDRGTAGVRTREAETSAAAPAASIPSASLVSLSDGPGSASGKFPGSRRQTPPHPLSGAGTPVPRSPSEPGLGRGERAGAGARPDFGTEPPRPGRAGLPLRG